MNDHIEQLALRKNFTALNTAERALVLAEMSQETFDQLHDFLHVARGLDAGVRPSGQLGDFLRTRMAAQTKPGGIHRLLTAKISAWQAAAVLLLGIGAMTFWKKPTVIEKPVAVVEWRMDTIFQEKIVWRDRVIVKNKVVFKEPPAQPIARFTEKIDHQETRIDFPTPEFTTPHVGTSLDDAPELMNFFTQGDR